MYKIGEFSRVCRTTIKTLRYYDELGILKPNFIDGLSGYRYYSPSKIAEYNKIMVLKETGFSLEEIKANFLNLSYENALLLLENKRIELLKAINESQTRLTKLDTLRKLISEEVKNMDFNVTVKATDLIRIAGIRGIYKDRQSANEKINCIKKFLSDNKVCSSQICAIKNYDIEYLNSDVDLSIGVQILGTLPKNDIVNEIIIQPYESAASLVCESNDKVRELAYSSLIYWLENNAYQITGAFVEIYHDEKTLEIIVPVHKYENNSDDSKKIHSLSNSIPFEDDEQVIGKWELLDILPSREQFCKEKLKYSSRKIATEIYFLPDGQKYWIWGWTKNYLIWNGSSYNKYTMENIDGQQYMFVELVLGNDISKGALPEVYVLKKADGTHYTREDLMLRDKTDYPFINDKLVLGSWISCDCVNSIAGFNPEKKLFSKDNLWFKKIYFKGNGELEECYGESKIITSPSISWTKGLTLQHKLKTAPAYELHRINGCDYLFIEWKSGDYIFGKRKPCYYVFNREK
jgi:DNA-binding transcriptional MerR regulator